MFDSWTDERPRLHGAWADAGDRLGPRIEGLAREVATGETGFAAAAELARSGVEHGLEPSTPFVALDTAACREHGADYAVQWAETAFDAPDGAK